MVGAGGGEGDDALTLRAPPWTGVPVEPWNLYYLLSQRNLATHGQPSRDLRVAVTPNGEPAGGPSYAAAGALRGRPMALIPQPPPSPLQQWIPSQPDDMENPAYCVGAPVRLCYLSAPGVNIYDKMVGDIIKAQSTPAGYVFDVRCPLFPLLLQNRHLQKEQSHYRVPVSKAAAQGAKRNRAIMAPVYGMTEADAEEDDGEGSPLPPFVLVNGLPSEKLDPLSSGDAVPGSLPRLVRPPIWGPPLTQEERAALEERLRRAAAPPRVSAGDMGSEDMHASAQLGHPAAGRVDPSFAPSGGMPAATAPCGSRLDGAGAGMMSSGFGMRAPGALAPGMEGHAVFGADALGPTAMGSNHVSVGAMYPGMMGFMPMGNPMMHGAVRPDMMMSDARTPGPFGYNAMAPYSMMPGRVQ